LIVQLLSRESFPPRQVPFNRDTDVFIIYKMPDGSSCHHVTSSWYRGTDVANDQGGREVVEVGLGSV
jgi:hypothetical protein